MTRHHQSIFGYGIIPPYEILRGPRAEREVAHAETVRRLWWYYEQNGLYDALRLSGYIVGDQRVKSLYNPAYRSVEFYAATVWNTWPLPIVPDSTASELLLPALERIWSWSNWPHIAGLHVRTAAIAGDSFLKVAVSETGRTDGRRVYIQQIQPEHVTSINHDERGYVEAIRIDVPRVSRMPDGSTRHLTHTEIWVGPVGRVYLHAGSASTPESELAGGEEIDLSGIVDFVPIVQVMHHNLGGSRGVGVFALQLEKIDEANRLASRFHRMLFRSNDVTWALRANLVDQATGRPMPAPRIEDGASEVEVGGERMLRLPGNTSLEALVPNLNYDAMLNALVSQMHELEGDLPELTWYRLRELGGGNISGVAIDALMSPAIVRAEEVRARHDSALVRVHKMALSIGEAVGAWQRVGLGSFGDDAYERGLFDHEIAQRPVLRKSRADVAETVAAEVNVGIPLITALRRSGWSDEQIAELLEDAAEQRRNESQALADAMLDAGTGALASGLEL